MKLIVRLTLLFLAISIYSHAKQGFFSVTQDKGVWWLVDPQGHKFFCKASNSIGVGSDERFDPSNPAYRGLKYYPSEAVWAVETAKRLKSWGFNTIGGYSDQSIIDQKMPYTLALTLGGWWVGFPWVDLQSREGLAKLKEMAAPLRRHRGDPNLIGYFIDNEMGWWDEALFQHWMSQPSSERIKRRLWAMLKEEYGGDLARFKADFIVTPSPASLNDVKEKLTAVTLGPGRRPAVIDRFVFWLADEFYATVCAEVRKADPDHLLLGDRYLSFYSQPVARAAGKYMDVVSTNYNTFDPSGWVSPSFFESLYALSGKPLMVTEYYFSAMENSTGNKNQHGPFIVVKTQKERAAGAAEMTRRLARIPSLVGYHWFSFTDEPPKGRGDGEDFNFGLIDIWNKPYAEVVQSLTAANRQAEELHAATLPAPGLRKTGHAWDVPAARHALTVDGSFKDWELASAWIPEEASKAPYARFGDFYTCWKPDGLYVGAVYIDYSWNAPRLVPLDRERVVLKAGLPGQPAREIEISGIFDRIGPEPVLKDAKDPDPRPIAPLTVKVDGTPRAGSPSSSSSIRAERGQNSLTTMVEIRLPPALFGLKKFKPGQTLNLGASIRLRGDAKVTYWPASSSDGDTAPLILR